MMPMTLRDYLIRRNRIVVIPGALLTLTAVIFAVYASKESAREFAVFCMLLSIAVAGIFSNRARCPKCDARLGHIEYEKRSRRGGPTPVGFDRCLSCGLHVSEEIPVRSPREF
jgi:hypothetical protein